MTQRDSRGRIAPALAVLLAGVLIVATAVFVLYWSDDGTDEDRGDDEPLVALHEKKDDRGGVPAASEERDGESAAADDGAGEAPGRQTVPREGIFLSGRVIDRETEEPIPCYIIRMSRRAQKGIETWKEFLDERVEDEDGLFSFPLEEGGRIRLWVHTPTHRIFRTTFEVPPETGLAGEQYELDPGLTATGIVVDDFSGRPVEGALVAHVDVFDTKELIRLGLGSDLWTAHAVTDALGRFRLTGLPSGDSLSPWLDGKWRFAALHPDYAEGVGRAEPGTGMETVISLKPGFRVFGRMVDNNGDPAAGAVVTLSGDDTPMPRTAVTDSEGRYRTPPALPGPAFIHAGPHPASPLPSLSEESRRIRIKDKDVEVNFGPSADHVTWKGTVRDRQGSPMPGTVIRITPHDVTLEQQMQHCLERGVQSSEEGRFQVGRLAPGAYVVEVEPTAWAHSISIGKMTFEKPGVTERDIRIAGAEIRGIVQEKATGEPIRSRGYVRCSLWQDRFFRSFSSPIDEQGRFALLGLPAGTYRVSATITGFPSCTVEGIIVAKDEIRDDICIEVFIGGTMQIKVMGFEGSPVRQFDLSMGIEGGTEFFFGTQHIDADGAWELEWEREPGLYMITLDFKDSGSVTREVEIIAGRTTTVLILESEVRPPEGTVLVTGMVTTPDGAPAEGIKLFFFTTGGSGLETKDRIRTAVTDASGRYEAEAFWPGTGRVNAELGEGAQADFPNLIIPSSPPPVVNLDLVISSGIMTGILRDKRTGELLAEGGAEWWAFLRDAKTQRVVCQIQGGQTGHRFEIRGVPAGDYMLLVRAYGYLESTTGPYRLGEGETLDVGEVLLDPGGILVLEVVNNAGEAVTGYELLCNGKEVYTWHRNELSPGRFRYPWLPPGPATLVISAEGYLPSESSLVLTPGEPVEAKIVLIPK